MNCREVHEYVGDILDREVSREQREEFFSHVKACITCRNDYEIESLARGLVRSKLTRIRTPSHVAQTVLDSLPLTSGSSWRETLFGSRILAPALTAGIAAILLFFFFSGPPDNVSHTSENDIIRQSLDNFALIQAGELRPSMVACYPEVIVGYFQEQNANFAVSVFSDDSCEWYGAIANTYNGVNLAHIVYKRGDDLLYVYEVRKGEALQGSVLSLPGAAKKSLAETGWYTDPQHEECGVILWTVNETLCAAVSTMKKDRLLAFLTANHPSF